MEGYMPNWCNNSIEIEGPVEKIAALWLLAHRFTPTVEGALLNAMVPIGDWDYDRAVQAWGTKWDIDMQGLEFVDNEQGRARITGWFDSAWSPPLDAFQTYALANEDVYLELKYFEPGMSFTGVWDSEGGDAYWEDVGSLLDTTAEEDAVLYDLLEHFNIWDWFAEEEENLEIDLDGGVSATNE
jgi:hypothetical protein